MAFFDYRQNNSGGSFDESEGIAILMIIEADNAIEADELAERVGIYFEGCAAGRDCECCGDRWSRQWGDGDPVPSYYGEPIETAHSYRDVGYIIYYKDGRVVKSEVKRNPYP